MGEYVTNAAGDSIKIGTCESLYYLRADQLDRLSASGKAHVLERQDVYRFRFPFPEEDGEQPGGFDRYDYAVGLLGVDLAGLKVQGFGTVDDFGHGQVQFVSNKGYNTMLPCPESPSTALTIHRNGNVGGVLIRYQASRFGKLVTIAECGGCEGFIRFDDVDEARPLIEKILSMVDLVTLGGQRPRPEADRWFQIASRVLWGYLNPPEWVSDRSPDVAPDLAERMLLAVTT